MAKQNDSVEKKQVRGVAEDLLPNATFKITLEDGREIIGHLSGKMRMYRIRVLAGDQVLVEMSEYDKDRGRIVRRL